MGWSSPVGNRRAGKGSLKLTAGVRLPSVEAIKSVRRLKPVSGPFELCPK